MDHQEIKTSVSQSKVSASKLVLLGDQLELNRPNILTQYLEAIFKDRDFSEQLKNLILESNVSLSSVGELIEFLHQIFKETDPSEHLKDLLHYEATVKSSLDAFSTAGKTNPNAVFWPSIDRDPLNSVFNCIPFVRNLGWLNMRTPIGSAGSCFSSEIAFSLQKRGFNYLVTENFYRLEEGVWADDYDVESKLAGSSANWGILFNTGSFRQLAEAAFGEIQLPPLLLKATYKGLSGQTADYFTSPFRENVYFKTPEAFEIDAPKHLAAVRQALTKAKVFVVTPGLNECWQMISSDLFMSRNPGSSAIRNLVKHRVLSVEENIFNLQRFIDLVRAHNPEVKFVISVSPVPLLATGLADRSHVVVANGHSKAVLRVAVEEVVRKNTDIAYFPSYEIVTSCSKEPFEQDARHVTRLTVDRIMKVFDAMFVSEN